MASDNAGLAWHNEPRQHHRARSHVSPRSAHHSLHLHHVCCSLDLGFFFLKKKKKNLNKHPPASDAELKVFSIGLFGGCHPCMRTHREDHSSPGREILQVLAEGEKKKPQSLRNPSLSLLPFGAVRVVEAEEEGEGEEGEALCDRVCVHRCRRPLRKRIQRNVLRPVLHIMRSFSGNQTVQKRENLRCCGGMRALDVPYAWMRACAACVRCVKVSVSLSYKRRTAIDRVL